MADLIIQPTVHGLLWKSTFLVCWAIKLRKGRAMLGHSVAVVFITKGHSLWWNTNFLLLYFTHPFKSAHATKLLPYFREVLADKWSICLAIYFM